MALEGCSPHRSVRRHLLTSAFPDMLDPAVAIDIYKGDTGLDTGIPQSIFTELRMINQGRLVKQARQPEARRVHHPGRWHRGAVRRRRGIRLPAGVSRSRSELGAGLRDHHDGRLWPRW
ncbi:cytochrome c biogenesis protein ResB [Rhodococcus pyridinivorans]|uniref:cytochrome c biogenesis protein ResB n=1 Tax=Rhodococcus pyridinivorans TaxID=103816 RepID=UPI002F90C599